MDRAFIAKMGKLRSREPVVFHIGHDTTFHREGDRLLVRYEPPGSRAIEHELMSIAQLVEGHEAFESTRGQPPDKYLPLLMAIEVAIDSSCKQNPALTDKMVLAVLERLVARPDVRMDSDLVNTIQANVRLVLSTSPFSLKELTGCLRKIQRSAKLHHSIDGPTGYLDFIKQTIGNSEFM